MADRVSLRYNARGSWRREVWEMPMKTEPSVLPSSRAAGLPLALRGMVGAVVFVMLVALAAQIRIPLPFTPVPLTLQVFVVALAGYMLGGGWGAVSLGLYLSIGLAGAPVFSGGASGTSALTGITAGYLLSYPAAAFLTGGLAGRGRRPARRVVAGLAGLAVIHAGGALWLGLFASQAPDSVLGLLTWSLLPFMGVDVVKVLAAEWLSRP